MQADSWLGREVFVVDAVRTPVGRLGGALVRGPARRPRRRGDQGAARRGRPASTRPGSARCYFGAANQAGEDNRNVARMAVAARRAADVGARLDGQPAVRLRPRRGGRRRPHDRGRGRVDHGRRRGRVDDPGAVRAAQAGAAVPGRQRDDVLHDARLADGQPGHARGVDGQPRGEHRAARRAVRRRPRGRRRVRRPLARAGRRRRGRPARTTRRSCRCPARRWPATRASARASRLESLAELKPSFREDGTVTAGNASQLSDGAAALLLADEAGRRRARRRAAGPDHRDRRGRGRPAVLRDRAGAGGRTGRWPRPAAASPTSPRWSSTRRSPRSRWPACREWHGPRPRDGQPARRGDRHRPPARLLRRPAGRRGRPPARRGRLRRRGRGAVHRRRARAWP